MDPLEPFNYSHNAELQYATYRSNSNWRRTYSFLAGSYWHATTPDSWSQILESGAIRPNINGRYPIRFSVNTPLSYGYTNGYVSLFDFHTPSENDAIRLWDRVHDILTDPVRETVLVKLNANNLLSKLIPNSEGWDRTRQTYKAGGCIPICETWYPDDIPTSWVENAYRLKPSSALDVFHWTQIKN